MNAHHRLTRLLALATLLTPSLAFAQTPTPRIRGPIEPTPSVTLPGSLNPHIRTADDLGALPSDTPIPGITLIFSRSPDQQSALDQLLADQTNPASPLFHHWLTPAEFNARFAPAPSDIAATSAWLQSRGFTIDNASPAPDRITFSGTAAQIHQAFGAELHRFRSPAAENKPAELHFAPASEIALPASLAPVTAAVLHLSDFRPKPNVRPRPNFTASTTQAHFLDPQDIGTMYDVWPLLSVGNATQGQGIAIVGQTFVQTGYGSMIYVFSRYMGGGRITPVLVPNSGVDAIFNGDLGESDIDLEYGSVFAAGANVFFVYTGSSTSYDAFDALSYAITQNIAPVISISYDECELAAGSTEVQQLNATLQQGAAQGQTVVVASGDQGATACADYDTSTGVTSVQQQSLAVNFPASSPYVTAVGGTQMAPATFAAGAGNQYWTPSTAAIGDVDQSLLGYVPELVWNEDSPTQGIFSSGGGASSIFARPSWQAGVPGIPSGAFRLIPDVALQASVANPGYIICSDDPYLTGGQTDCNNSVQLGSNSYLLNGGTSFAAPLFASALVAISASVHAYGLGNINPVLYSLAAQPSHYSNVFHDITSGSTACVSGDGNCGAAGQSNFSATVGFDQTTGLGSLDFANLAAAWPAVAPSNLAPTYISFNGSESSVNPGAPLALQMTVWNVDPNFSSTLPTGTLSFTLDGNVLASSVPLPANSTDLGAMVDYTVASTPTSGINHIVTATYSGDSAHYPTTSTFVFSEGQGVATGNIALSAPNLTIAGNGSGSTSVSITPSGGYNGMLNWTIGISGGTVATYYCYLVEAPPVNGLTTGTVDLGVGTACDSPTSLQSRSSSTVQRASSSASQRPASAARLPANAARLPAGAALALLLCAIFPARRRKLLPLLAVLTLAVLPFALSGCGGSSGSGSGGGGGGGGTTAQVYTVTITAKDSVQSSITASTTFTLTVD